MRQRLIAAVATAAFLLIAAGSASAANTLGPPPWQGTLCPPIGADTGCQYGIDVTAVDGSGVATTQSIAKDGDQGAYDGDEDAMVVIKNDATTALTSIPMGIAGSGQDLFGFDSDGLCSGSGPSSTWTPPAGCPFGTTGYEGPGTSFTVTDSDSGTVNFSPALAPGQTTYFSLETNPGIVPTAGKANNWITSQITAPGKAPDTYVAVPQGTNVTDQAIVNGKHGATLANGGAVDGDGTAAGTIVYTLYANDRSCSTTPVYTSAPKSVTAGITSPSDPVSAGIAAPSGPIGASLPAGRYYWLETYSGDGGPPTHNNASQSLCGQEIVGIGSTLITTKLSATTVLPNTPVTDVAHIAAVVPKTLSDGTVDFGIFTDSACKVPYTGAAFGLTGISPFGTTATSPSVSLPSGVYNFVASYSGDSKNGSGSSACGSEVLHVANNAFTVIKKPTAGKGYKLTFTVSVTDPGKFSWAFTAGNKKGLFKSVDIAVTASGKKCGKGKIKVKGKCVPATVKYGSGSRQITAGIATITVSPSGKVLKALKAGHTLKLTGLLTFQSAFGGKGTSQPASASVHGHKTKPPCTAKRKKKHQCKK